MRQIIFWLTTLILGDSIYFQRSTKGSKMYQLDLLSDSGYYTENI